MDTINRFTNSEMTDMMKILGKCDGNSTAAARMYRDMFPNRIAPNRKTFLTIERRLREHGSFKPIMINCGTRRRVRNQDTEELILQEVERNPKTSIRRIGHTLGVSRASVHRVLQEQLLHPYHLQQVQELLPRDFESRVEFCQFILRKNNEDPNFPEYILFTDEACFTKTGITNVHNDHIWADENPNAIRMKHSQYEFSINVWLGVIGSCLVGPVALPNRLTGANYLEFLVQTLPDLLDDLPLMTRHNMNFMLDGAPPHFSREVRDFLNNTYPDKWIGRGGPIEWPPRSPDLTPCDFYLWGYIKSQVYSHEINSREQLWQLIEETCNGIRNDPRGLQGLKFSFLRRVRLCVRENGGHFEQYL